jgi:hypothetical protein
MLRRLLFALFLTFLMGATFAQKGWRLLSTTDGLPSNNCRDVILVDSTSFYLATDAGLFIETGSNTFLYDTSNSSIPSNNIIELLVRNGNLWFSSDSGLCEFDGRTFTNYNTSNGLLSNQINDITLDTNENIWIASNAGVSRFDGVQFVHDTGRLAYTIGVDNSNRVYITKFPVIFNLPSFGLDPIEMFDGQNWSIPTLGNFAENYRARFYKTPKGPIYFVPFDGLKQFYGELVSPFEIKKKSINTEIPFPITPYYINEVNGYQWLGYDGLSPIYRGSAKDSSYSPIYLMPDGSRIRNMSAFGNQLAIATSAGLLIGPSNFSDLEIEERLDVNQIGAAMNAKGSMFTDHNDGSSEFEYPLGSGRHLFSNLDFQFGVIRDSANLNRELFSLDLYGLNYDLGPQPKSNQIFGDEYLIKIDRQAIDQHIQSYNQPNYAVPKVIRDWPAAYDTNLFDNFDLAPFVDLNSNGCYEPAQGDYPAIEGDQAIYWINRPESDLPLEFQWMLYGYNSSVDTFLNRTVFLRLRIVNRDTQRIDYLKVGMKAEADIGNPNDDFAGSDSVREAMYFFNGDAIDENSSSGLGYNTNAPALGISTLNESMASAIFQITRISNTPLATNWNLLHGLNGDGNSFTDPFTGRRTTYQYSGDPFFNIGWTETNTSANILSGNNPGSRNGTMSIPSFGLDPGESKTIDYAIIVAQRNFKLGFAEYVPLLKGIMDQVKAHYDNRPNQSAVLGRGPNCQVIITSIDEEVFGSNELKIYPNPAKGILWIESKSAIEQIELWSVDGRKVLELSPRSQSANLQLPALNNGIYLIRAFDGEQWQQRKLLIKN